MTHVKLRGVGDIILDVAPWSCVGQDIRQSTIHQCLHVARMLLFKDSRDVLHFLHTVLTPEERTNLWVRISGRIPEANNKLGDTERVAIVTNLLQ